MRRIPQPDLGVCISPDAEAITGAFKNEDVVADELLVHKGKLFWMKKMICSFKIRSRGAKL